MAENGRGKAGSARRQERHEQALRHIREVDQTLQGELARSKAELRRYEGMPKTAVLGCVPSVEVRNQDTVSCVLELGRGLASACNLAALDFASFINPGGGYEGGAWAQEEALCAESTLYNILRDERAWYGENRRRNINCNLYRDRALAVPKVRFERERYHSYADVIVCAAPNAKRAKDEYHVSDTALFAAMRSRIRLVLAIADDLGDELLVLGAFGCGVFGWDASVVAELFRAELASGKHAPSRVVFAIPQGRFDDNLSRFEHALADFPEANPEPWVKPARKAAPKRETKAAEDENDWRRYL